MSDAYAEAGVNYNELDPFKTHAQNAARGTARLGARHGLEELAWSRGESAYLARMPDGRIMGLVEEGLGTKNLVAAAFQQKAGKSHFAAIAQDTVAMIVNDLLTLGVLPALLTMHAAVGRSDWFTDKQRTSDLINGWANACHMAGATWACGESPVLKGNVEPDGIVLNGSAVGFTTEDTLQNPEDIQPGDRIIVLPSSGIHANGLTLARDAATKIVDGYATRLSNGKTFGEALLSPTAIYVDAVTACQAAGRACGERLIRYAVNITGHGWRKLMRASKRFTYIIEKLPTPQEEFDLIQRVADMSDRDMYATFNMGGGFALFVPPKHAQLVLSVLDANGYHGAYLAGYVEDGPRRVCLHPLDVEYREEELQIR